MIVFNLDSTLANCEHRRHFVDPLKNENYFRYNGDDFRGWKDGKPELDIKWKPDWKAFYQACDKDTPIDPVIEMWNNQISFGMMGVHQIWSGRCESVRKKTEEWLSKNLLCFESKQLKMRPIGDYTPDDQLKERWLDEMIQQSCDDVVKGKKEHHSGVNEIDFVFDSDPQSIKMWRRRSIFVFNCCQNEEEF